MRTKREGVRMANTFGFESLAKARAWAKRIRRSGGTFSDGALDLRCPDGAQLTAIVKRRRKDRRAHPLAPFTVRVGCRRVH